MDPKKSEVLQGTPENASRLGAPSRFWHRPPLRAAQRGSATTERTHPLYLLPPQQHGWIASEWGTSENNRKAKFYSITGRGLKRLAIETESWEWISGVIGRVLRIAERG
jgi:PadR family transcriptional regulator